MPALTEGLRFAFADWMASLLGANARSIAEARSNVKFDVEGYQKQLADKLSAYREAEGEMSRIEQAKLEQTSLANTRLGEMYNTASDLADAIVGHLGRGHKISRLIRRRRDSMINEEARGKRGSDETPEEPASQE